MYMGAPMYEGMWVPMYCCDVSIFFLISLHPACFLPSPRVFHRVGLAHSFGHFFFYSRAKT